MSTPKWEWQPEWPRWQLFVSRLWADVCQRGDEWHWQVQIEIEEDGGWHLGGGVAPDAETGKAEVLRAAEVWFADGLAQVKVLQSAMMPWPVDAAVEKSQAAAEPEICGYLFDVGRICRREPGHEGVHAAIRHSDMPREEAVRIAMRDYECPYCGAEMDCESKHERDSSNDVHFCPNCRWSYGEMETWGRS